MSWKPRNEESSFSAFCFESYLYGSKIIHSKSATFLPDVCQCVQVFTNVGSGLEKIVETLKFSPVHVKRSFDNPAEKFSPKGQFFFAQIPKMIKF